VVRRGDEDWDRLHKRIARALEAAQKYSLIANSLKSEVIVEPTVEIVEETEYEPA
jgi:uncharacterized OsmC-like protein